MKKIIGKITRALQVILMAPIKLPGKALSIIRYIALGLGVVESVLEDKVKNGVEELSKSEPTVDQTEKEVIDEIE